MKKLQLLSTIPMLLFFMPNNVMAQDQNPPGPPPGPIRPIHTSLAVIAMLSIMFSVMFIVLAYAKFCHRVPNHINQNQISLRSGPRFSGIDREVVESLPFFRFSTLRGSKDGLECSVCLSKFDDSETLRLLPNCNHAFHVACIDRWLEGHSSCPLCRHKLNPKEISNFSYSMSLRFNLNPSNSSRDDLNDNNNLELYVQREEDRHGSCRYSDERRNKEFDLLVEDNSVENRGHDLPGITYDKFKHKIIVSDVMVKNRWSDVNSSDLMSLNSDMLGELSSKRFFESRSFRVSGQISRIKEDIERKRLQDTIMAITSSSCDCSSSFEDSRPRKIVDSSVGKRSMSEITNMSRFALSLKSRSKESPIIGKDERIRRVWLPIARRTVQWLAGRERGSDDAEEDKFRRLNV